MNLFIASWRRGGCDPTYVFRTSMEISTKYRVVQVGWPNFRHFIGNEFWKGQLTLTSGLQPNSRTAVNQIPEAFELFMAICRRYSFHMWVFLRFLMHSFPLLTVPWQAVTPAESCVQQDPKVGQPYIFSRYTWFWDLELSFGNIDSLRKFPVHGPGILWS